MLPKLIYFSSRAVINIRENLFANIITISAVAISFLIFSSFMLLANNISSLFKLWSKEVQIEAYLLKTATPESTEKTKKMIMDMPEVDTVIYVSKEEALERFKKNLGSMSQIAENLDGNPLPASFKVRLTAEARTEDKVKKVATFIKKLKVIDDVIYGQEWIEKFSTIFTITRLIGLTIGSMLIIATILIVSNTIKLTVYARKDELEIMKLVGADNFFIKTPFYLEGIIQGLAGSAASVVILYAIYRLFIIKLKSTYGIALASNSFQLNFLPSQEIYLLLAGGVILGFFGSFVSLGRFLKV